MKRPTCILIATIGQRDIQFDTSLVQEILDKHNVAINVNTRNFQRAFGEAVLQNQNLFNELRPHLSYPILNPVLKKVCKQYDLKELILIVTDQANENYRAGDTINFGKILKHLIPKEFKTSFKISIWPITEQVTQIDAQYALFKKKVKSLRDRSNSIDFFCVFPQGGVDAINMALTLNMLGEFGTKNRLFNINEQQHVNVIQLPTILKSESEINQAIALLKKYNYSAIEEFDSLSDEVKAICRHLNARLNFDFNKAQNEIDDFDIDFSNLRNLKNSLCTDIETLIELQNNQPTHRDLLKELFYNIMIVYERKQFADFLARMFRLIEGGFCYLALSKMNGFSFSKKSWSSDIKMFLSKPENIALNEYLSNLTIGPKKEKIDLQRLPTRLVWYEIANFFYKNEDNTLLMELKKWQDVSDLRNHSIGAHGFQPASLEAIAQVYGEPNNPEIPFENLKNACFAAFSLQSNPFDECNEVLIDHLKNQ